jgi:hypothetical protein
MRDIASEHKGCSVGAFVLDAVDVHPDGSLHHPEGLLGIGMAVERRSLASGGEVVEHGEGAARALLVAAHPEVAASSLLPPAAPSDPLERLRIVVREITQITRSTEPALRTMLRLSLEQGGQRRDLSLRKGRRLVWVADALTPLQGTMDQARLDAMTVAIAASVGIEVYIWLQDIAGLDPDQAAASICWTAETIFLGTIHTDTPPPPVATRQH